MNQSGRADRPVEALRPLLVGLFTDCMIHHPDHFLEKDLIRLLRRVDSRGMRVLTVELPELAKALDSSLVECTWSGSKHFRNAHNGLPLLFNDAFKGIFDSAGHIRTDANVGVIRDIRSLGYLFYKYELPYAEDTERAAFEKFKATDAALPTQLPRALKPILDKARTLLGRLLEDLDPRTLKPRHSNGAVAMGEKNHEKMGGLSAHPIHEELMPYYDITSAHWLDHLTREPVQVAERIARLTTVPKDSRGPRLICIEPVTQQYLQQGLKDLLYDHIERHPLTRGHVNFRDQTINGRWALLGSSIERDTVTLDMSEASDRISNELVLELFPPAWRRALQAARTPFVRMPDAEVLMIKKYAPMGSGLCFPVEALVHWVICIATLTEGYNMSEKDALKSVYVYGDDIIVRGAPYKGFFRVFPLLGMKFNEHKCCVDGRFRESCGVDAYDGENVTPLKIKKLMPSGPSSISVTSWAKYADEAFARGNWNLAKAIEALIHQRIGRTLPFVRKDSGAVGYSGGFSRPRFATLRMQKRRYNRNLHRLECRSLKVAGKKVHPVSDRCLYHQALVDHSTRKEGSEPTLREWAHAHAARCVLGWVDGVVSPYI